MIGSGLAMCTIDIARVNMEWLPFTIRWAHRQSASIKNITK